MVSLFTEQTRSKNGKEVSAINKKCHFVEQCVRKEVLINSFHLKVIFIVSIDCPWLACCDYDNFKATFEQQLGWLIFLFVCMSTRCLFVN